MKARGSPRNFFHVTTDWESSGGISDDNLLAILAVVGMDSIVDREGGWGVTREWREALSGGDQQKIAWARLFYHKPKASSSLFLPLLQR